jgi:hypothetical protein
VNWVAASLWASAALFFNGTLAYFEDAQPDGFDNPSRTVPLPFARGASALKYWASSLGVCVALASAGVLAQLYL